MFAERFSSVLIKMRDDAIASLPICNEDCEVIFFYYSTSLDANTFRVGEVTNIFKRNFISNEIIELGVDNVIALHNIDLSKTYANFLYPVKTRDSRKRYLELYEEYFNKITSSNKPDTDVCQRLWVLFNSLVPDSPLREIYFSLGESYFSKIKGY